jgi:hypothetical protein
MKHQLLVATAAGLLAALSIQQAHAEYGNGLQMSPSGTAITEEMLERCAELGISRVQCNEVSILQAERVEVAASSKEKGSGTSLITTEVGQMAAFMGVLGVIFGGIAAAFFLKGRRAKPVPA